MHALCLVTALQPTELQIPPTHPCQVLRLSGVATAAYSATLLVVPRTSHDTFYVAQVGRCRRSLLR